MSILSLIAAAQFNVVAQADANFRRAEANARAAAANVRAADAPLCPDSPDGNHHAGLIGSDEDLSTECRVCYFCGEKAGGGK